ncbi:MAG: hypothetical protein U0559_09325 [Anaerolineae bacterium]
MQFPITRRIEDKPPLLMMAAGSALAIGFAMYGAVNGYCRSCWQWSSSRSAMVVALVSQSLDGSLRA